MKVVYLLRNRGIETRTPSGWESAVMAPEADRVYSEENLEQLADADFLVVGLEPASEIVFARAPRLRLVQRLGVGYDNVDLHAAARYGVPVCNLPDFNAATVAEHAMMLILALQRRVFESTLLMKAGQWPLTAVAYHGIYELQGKTVGILGLGTIGREFARRVRAFDTRILYYDRRRPSPREEDAMRVEHAPLIDLLQESDVVSCHLPLTPESRHLIGRSELQLMKKSALLINTARGAIVDEDALAEALNEGSLAGAGLDVYSTEPLEARHSLRTCKNVVLTPHTAGQSREAMERMVHSMLDNLHRVARGEEPRYRVA